jgi:hypothetical protein
MTEPWWRTLLREQQGSGFADLAGAEGSVVLPVSDRLLTSVIASRIPAGAPVSNVQVAAAANDQFAVRIKLVSPAFLPPFTLRFAIDRQPQMPASPILTLAIVTQGIGTFAGPLVRAFAGLPAWVRIDHDRVHVDLRQLAQQYGVAEHLRVLTDVRLTTVPGRFIVTARASLP